MSASITLYQIEDYLRALIDTADGMEESDEQRLAILADIAEANSAAIQKRDNVIRFLRHLEIQESGIDAEIDRLKALKAHYSKGRERLEKYVVSVLEQLPQPKRGARKLEGTIGVLSLRKNPDKVEIFEGDEALVPAQYRDVTLTVRGETFEAILDSGLLPEDVRTCHKPKKAEIKRAIERGEEVPGADLKFGENGLVVR